MDEYPHSSRRGPKSKFSDADDTRLVNLIARHGKRWQFISKKMNKTSKQCRERYNNYLDPNLNELPWKKEEDTTLIEQYELLGPKWTLITNSFDHRSVNSVRNRWLKLKRMNEKDCNGEGVLSGQVKFIKSVNDTFDSDFDESELKNISPEDKANLLRRAYKLIPIMDSYQKDLHIYDLFFTNDDSRSLYEPTRFTV